MRVAIVSPVWFAVPPIGYGGIEWVVSLLADGLVDAGHDVTLFASGDSKTKARLVWEYERAPSSWIGRSYWEMRHALAALEQANDFDIMNDHTGMLGLLLGGLTDVPLVHTVHGPLLGEDGDMYARICRLVPRARLISVSENQRSPRPDLPWVATCYNAIELSLYPAREERGEYLLFVGRMTADKGAHRAIAVAQETGLPLKLCGKKQEELEQQYFDAEVAPHLGEQIEYMGEVSHWEKVELLQDARATLFPIDWEEPFGLVMIESMACGTPVIATRRGAVPEVVEHGRSGIIVDDVSEMAAAVERADSISSLECRRSAEERFSPERMVAAYVAAYSAVIEASAPPG